MYFLYKAHLSLLALRNHTKYFTSIPGGDILRRKIANEKYKNLANVDLIYIDHKNNGCLQYKS